MQNVLLSFWGKEISFFQFVELDFKITWCSLPPGTVCLTLFSQVHQAPVWDLIAAVLVQHILDIKYLELG